VKRVNPIKQAWGLLVWLFERADIIPPLIIVSAWHYAGALADYDPLPVAVALGVLIDLGHYRSVKVTIANNTWRRFSVMTVLTVMTGYFHWLWYKNLILALAVPTLIICLSLLSKWGGWERQSIVFANQANVKQTEAKPEQKAFACEICQAEFDTQKQLSGHIGGKHGARKARKDGGNG